MAANRHATRNHMFIYICISVLLPMVNESAAEIAEVQNDDSGMRLTREYHLRQGALRGLIVKPSRQYDLQKIEMFLGIPYAAPPIGNLRFMPPVNAPPWPGVKKAVRFAPVCPQVIPSVKKGNPPSLGRQHYMGRLKPFLEHESEDCLYLNIYVPFREQKPKKFPVLVFIHGDSFEWSSGNPYDGKILASYGNIMVITVNFRLGILGFLKPSLTEHDYGNNGLLDQLAALTWIKDNIEDLNGDPQSVTLMGHGTGAACVSFLMMSPISNGNCIYVSSLFSYVKLIDLYIIYKGCSRIIRWAEEGYFILMIFRCFVRETDLVPFLVVTFIYTPNSPPSSLFHRAILMSGSALSDWAMTRDPTQYTLQVAQRLGCNPSSKDMMTCLQNKPLSDIKKVQILARQFETPLGPSVAGYFIPNEPAKTMESFPNLLSKYQLLSGVTELESYHDFGVIELDHGILENQRDDFIRKYARVVFNGAEDIALKETLKQYAPSKLDPQRWSVEANRDVILNLFSDARTLAPMISFANYQSKANWQSYFYVFGHNSVSTDYAPLNKSVHGEELPYILGVPLGGANTHFHSDYTTNEKLLSEVMMRLWTNFVKLGTPNTQSVNEYYTLDRKQWNKYNVEWPEYDVSHQSYLRLDIPPFISSLYRANYTNFWIESLPNKLKRYVIDPLYEFSPVVTSARPKPAHRNIDSIPRKILPSRGFDPGPRSNPSPYGKITPYAPPRYKPDTEMIYREIQSIKTPARPVPPGLMEKPFAYTTTTEKAKPTSLPIKASGATITLIVSLGILFFAVNIGICAILYLKKRKLRMNERSVNNAGHSRAEIGDVDIIGQKSAKDDKSALKSFKNSCSVIKSISIGKMKGSNNKSKKKSEVCKTPKSDDSGGFRERFQLRRHLSTSTLDAHTKVRDWIANEVMHRCSPNVLTKSNSDLNTDKQITVAKPFTRSEELLADAKKINKDPLIVDSSLKSKTLQSKTSHKTKTSEKTTSTSALGSHSSIGSNKHSLTSSKQAGKSNDSLKSRGTESVKSKKVSVAIDATPASRTPSILSQKPIELMKSLDNKETKHSNQESKPHSKIDYDTIEIKLEKSQENTKTFTNEVKLSLDRNGPLKIAHKHSSSDPVSDVNYELLKYKLERGDQIVDILPPVTFRNDVNVTSRDESLNNQPLTAAEALLTIQRRNFPKVLPDLPKSQKRLSLQPSALQTFRSYVGSAEPDRPKVPPQPPPRTTTLERRLAYKNTKPLSSFGVSNVNKISEFDVSNKNYENIESLSVDTSKVISKSFESSTPSTISKTEIAATVLKERELPKVIIASSDTPNKLESKILIKPSASQIEIPSNAPRVRLPDDFHSQTTGSVTSFSSFCSDDDIDDIDDDFPEDINEDKLIKELVGGVESMIFEDTLDTKGPSTIFDKRLEIVPVKINPGHIAPKNKEDYVCVSDLQLPDVSKFEQTAKIKPNFGLNKLQHRSESINKPPEKAVKVKHKRTLTPTKILNKSLRKSGDKTKSDSSKLEHSTSGSSNDTETSTGTVRKVELNKE